MFRILLVEDDPEISGVLERQLTAWNYQVGLIRDFRDVLGDFRTFQPHLVLLDIGLPYRNGYHWCEEIRKISKVPILFLSSASDNLNIIMAVNLGGDDFLAKPFDLDELLARIEVQLRHRGRALASQPGGDVLCVGAWAIDRAARTLTVDGAEVPLTRTEFNIVELLAAHPRKVYTKQELFELAWGEPYAAEDSTVSVHVSNIRAKLKPTGTDGYVQTVWGLGFKLAVDEGA